MSTIVTRAGKGSPLTNNEVDANFTNLNTDKIESITSSDGSIVIIPSGTSIDLAVSEASPASTLLTAIRNTTGATLTKGTVVYISGATGQIATVSKALATSDATSAQTLGMVTADLANNSNGYVTVIGLITNIDTSAFTDGQQLYLSGTTAGAVTGTKPSAPIHLVYVAVVEHAHPTQGKLFVKVQNGYELDEIHDVQIVSPTTGQTIVYDATSSLWKNSNAPVISGTTIDNTVIGGTTPVAGTFTTLTATGQTSLGGAVGSESLRVLTPISAGGLRLQAGVPSSSVVRLGPAGSTVADFRILAPTFINFYTGSSSDGLLDGSAQMRVSHTASTVNYVQVTGAATGGIPTISAQGSDSFASINLSSKAGGDVRLVTASTTGWVRMLPNGTEVLRGVAVSSNVNYHQAQGSATGLGLQFSAQGTDTNISQVFQSKGTGAIDLAAGSSGVNISNGGAVTAITRTTAGSGYTSFPSIAISAPTTAGGVQATGTVTQMGATSATIQAGGTGYTLNDVITVSGGTPVSVGATYTVTGVSGGVITSVTPLNFATYTALPTNPVSVTGGTGSGVTLNLTYYFPGVVSITNAGSGYVEQPTVTFSGGGGSGATAYATVGSGTVVKSLGSTMDFYVPSGRGFQIYDGGGVPVNYWSTRGASSSSVPYLYAQGSDTNVFGGITSKGTGGIGIYTNAAAQQQFNVSHTASAVNYVQVTGAATGGQTLITAQGSDSSIDLGIKAKGSYDTYVGNASGWGLRARGTSSSGNYFQIAGVNAGSAPVLSVIGGDTNIDLNLTSKGSGVLNLNTGAGTQVRIIDSGGTAVNRIHLQGQASGFLPVIASRGSDTNLGMSYSTQGTGGHDFYTSGTSFTQQVKISHTASAVNYVQVTGGATGIGVQFTAQGSDANVSMTLKAKGTQTVTLGNGNIYNALEVEGLPSAVNLVRIQGTASGTGPKILALGTDTNIDLALTPKGTGALVAQASDGTTINARGANAVDWQTSRASASQVASATYSVIAGGQYNTANQSISVVGGGALNTASGYAGVVGGGYNNTTGGNYCFIGSGQSNQIINSNVSANSFIGAGTSNVAHGAYNFVGGGFTNAGTSASAVTTQSATMNGTTAVTLAASNASIKVGQYITGTSIASETYVAAVSGTSLTLSKVASGSSTSTLSFYTPHGVVVGGGNNQATGSYSFIGGGGDAGTAANRNVASGDWSAVGGGWKNVASGYGSVIAGGGIFGSGTGGGNIASGAGSTVGGGANQTASGFLSTVSGGYANNATRDGSVVTGGWSNIATSSYGSVNGGNLGTTRSLIGNSVFPSCTIPISGFNGVSQAALIILARETTNATATVLCSDANAAGTTNQVILPNNSAYYFRGEVVSGVTGGGNTKGWFIEGVIKRGANAASTALVGTPTVTSNYADAGASTWTIAVTADTTNGGLAVTFTGQASTTIRTVAQIRTTEMTY